MRQRKQLPSDRWIFIRSCNDCGFYPSEEEANKFNPKHLGAKDMTPEQQQAIMDAWYKKHGGKK